MDEVKALVTAYEQVFTTIAERLPGRVIRLDAVDQRPGPG
jgi:hypothetical protein